MSEFNKAANNTEALHKLLLELCDEVIGLKDNLQVSNDARVESYLMFFHYLIGRLRYYYSDRDEINFLSLSLIVKRQSYIASLRSDINSDEILNKLIQVRKDIYNDMDAKRQKILADQMHGGVKPQIPKEYINPKYDEVKEYPLYEKLVAYMKDCYCLSLGIDSLEEDNSFNFERWMSLASGAFSKIVYLIYENPLPQNIISSEDFNFIYDEFGLNWANCICTLDKVCIQIENYI